jgi:hypothetical protein
MLQAAALRSNSARSSPGGFFIAAWKNSCAFARQFPELSPFREDAVGAGESPRVSAFNFMLPPLVGYSLSAVQPDAASDHLIHVVVFRQRAIECSIGLGFKTQTPLSESFFSAGLPDECNHGNTTPPLVGLEMSASASAPGTSDRRSDALTYRSGTMRTASTGLGLDFIISIASCISCDN